MEDLDRVDVVAASTRPQQLADLAAHRRSTGTARSSARASASTATTRRSTALDAAGLTYECFCTAGRSARPPPRRTAPSVALPRHVPRAVGGRAGAPAARRDRRRVRLRSPGEPVTVDDAARRAVHGGRPTTSCCAATTACRRTTWPSSSTTPRRASTDVVRGDDLLASTPRQVAAAAPARPAARRATSTCRWSSAPTAHRLAKRHGAVTLADLGGRVDPGGASSARWPVARRRRSGADRDGRRPARRLRPRRPAPARVGRRSRSPTCNDPGRERAAGRTTSTACSATTTPSTSASGSPSSAPSCSSCRSGRRAFCAAVVRAAGLVGFAADPDDPVPGHEVSLAAISPRLYEVVQDDLGPADLAAAAGGLAADRLPRAARRVRHPLRDGRAGVAARAPRRRPGVGVGQARRRLRGRRAAVPPPGRRQRRACRSGSLLAWPSLVTHPHEVTPLRRGVKHGLTIWFELPFAGLDV